MGTIPALRRTGYLTKCLFIALKCRAGWSNVLSLYWNGGITELIVSVSKYIGSVLKQRGIVASCTFSWCSAL